MNKTQLSFISFLVIAMGVTFVGLQKSTDLPESIGITGWVIMGIGVAGMIGFGLAKIK